ASTRSVNLPAEYATVRRQKLKSPARTRKAVIPAEYAEIEKTIILEPGRMVWQRVICDERVSTNIGSLKNARAGMGDRTGPSRGRLDAQDWAALKDFQLKNGLAVGGLTYATF